MAVLTSYIPTNNSTKRILKYFVCDTYAELPTTFSIGDMATAEGKMYYAANVGMSLSWIELIAKPNNYALGSLVRNNTGTSNILTNQAVSINNNGVQPAFSSNSTNNVASGIALGNMPIGNPGIIVTNGYIESSNWSSATGSVNLTPNAVADDQLPLDL